MKQIIFIAILLTCAFGACSSDNDGDEQSASVQAPSDITIERMLSHIHIRRCRR